MRRLAGRRAFTLIEVLVVVAIIGILLAIAQPSFLGPIGHSKDEDIRQQLTTAAAALSAQSIAADGAMPATPEDVVKIVTAAQPGLKGKLAATAVPQEGAIGICKLTGQAVDFVGRSGSGKHFVVRAMPGGVSPVTQQACSPDAPNIVWLDKPQAKVAAPNATFAWSALDATGTCKLDGAAPVPCSSPHTFTGLDGGDHTMLLNACNPGGCSQSTVAWRVLTPAPMITFTQQPDATASSTTATFAWTAPGATTTTCKLDVGAAAACSSPKTFSGLTPNADHVMQVTACNDDDACSSKSVSWRINATVPTVTIASVPSGPSGTIRFTTTGDPTTINCYVTSWVPCTTATSHDVSVGYGADRTFYVAVSNAAGTSPNVTATWDDTSYIYDPPPWCDWSTPVIWSYNPDGSPNWGCMNRDDPPYWVYGGSWRID